MTNKVMKDLDFWAIKEKRKKLFYNTCSQVKQLVAEEMKQLFGERDWKILLIL